MHLHDILDNELRRFKAGNPLHIVETGTIRGDTEASRIGDGWSTVFFAEHVRQHHGPGSVVMTIDLEVDVAHKVLRDQGLSEWVTVIQGHSIKALAWLLADVKLADEKFDVVLLDSDNDGQLIFHEFLIAELLVKPDGLILVDDVQIPKTKITGARKGDVLLPYLQKNKTPYRLVEREGWNGYKTGVLAIDAINART